MADGGAKDVAAGRAGERQLRTPTLDRKEGTDQWEPYLCEDGVPVTRAKRQMRDRITNWLASHRGYRCTVRDMWSGREAAKLDSQASNEAVWGTAGGRGGLRLEQVLRARCLELKMNPGNSREVRTRIRQTERCTLCAEEGNRFHICSTCKHPDMRDFYTVRHNSVGKVLLHAMRQGKLGRWLTLTSCRRVDNQAEQRTVPDWLLPAADRAALRGCRVVAGQEGRTEDRSGALGEAGAQANPPADAESKGAGDSAPPTGGVQPDIVVLEGWPETADPPAGPVTHWESPEGHRRAVRVRVGELACTSDLQPEKTVDRKRVKYRPLIQALRKAGWNVVETVHVVTVGVRGTVPLANRAELGCCLGITTKKEQLPVQRAMAREAVRHLNIIVRQFRKLCGRGKRKIVGGGSRPDQGPPCTTIPGQCLAISRLDEGHRANLGRREHNTINNECIRRTGVG
eukprot:1187164-Prorocentrum_minimum.AAC.2